jgi:hypothetical protein
VKQSKMKQLVLIGSVLFALLFPVQSWATDRSDTFTGSDSANSITSGVHVTDDSTAGAWTNLAGQWGISSNKAYTPLGTAHAVIVLETNVSNVTIESTLGGTLTGAGLIARAQDNDNYFLLRVTTTALTVFYHHGAGVFDSIGDSGAITVLSTDTIKFVVDSDNVFKGYQNGTLRVTSSANSNLSTATQHGIRISSDSSVRWDDVTITEIGGGAQTFGFRKRVPQ